MSTAKGSYVDELAAHVESAFWQLGDPARKLALVRRLKADLLERLRPEADTWPISDDAIVVCSSGRDTKGRPITPLQLAYFNALRWCVAIEEATEWQDRLERGLVGALHGCAVPGMIVGRASKGGAKTARARQQKARQRQNELKAAALSMRAANPRLSNARVAEILAERTGRGKESIRKLLRKIPA